jgi:hypothetical protein
MNTESWPWYVRQAYESQQRYERRTPVQLELPMSGELIPDHIIILDYLIYRSGNASEQEAWDIVKKTLTRLAHAKDT